MPTLACSDGEKSADVLGVNLGLANTDTPERRRPNINDPLRRVFFARINSQCQYQFVA